MEYIIILLFFVVGYNLFVYFKTAGLVTIFSDEGIRPFEISEAYIKTTAGGLLFGFKTIWIETRFQPFVALRLMKWQRRIVWVFGVIILIVTTGIEINILYLWVLADYLFNKAISEAFLFAGSGVFVSFLVHCFFLSMAMSFVRQLRISFGETVFLNYLYGKYSNPLVEERYFMFLDLNNSTRIAESLGHVRYSRFLNKCFNDILEALQPFKYEVYQFVGDEVVHTWKTKEDVSGKAVTMFQTVREKLIDHKEEYIMHFGVEPSFKAGVSCGEVSATLVGRKQKSVAYHGDVLNTAARLLGHCKKLKTSFLCTDFYLKSLNVKIGFQPELLTELKLRGKNNTSLVYSASMFHLNKAI
ncbi:adenylate/guanylate cyclase domain-containing protein [Aquimarina celericrescens]|uniref:Adenylate/guanylate cyclase domain-containing protein n=1 Tax=Aquimarina celericrescens TaxID=1964542 RepID=A0ABW5AVK2_9FLAO|nr:adenylate/guanylate cyclase domain-containing protein [Aquimarina celericrescens]